jgi:L-aminopeptidase/D-esterase-like protein
VQCNCGRREQLRIAGVLVGREIPGKKLFAKVSGLEQEDSGSIIIVIATDAPLIPTQLKRLARRASLGLARTGSISRNSSGDIFIAFSTANGGAANPVGLRHLEMVPNERMDPLFSATIEATEEAIVNALVAAKTMTGINNRTVQALPHEPLRQVLRKYHRLVEPPGRE